MFLPRVWACKPQQQAASAAPSLLCYAGPGVVCALQHRCHSPFHLNILELTHHICVYTLSLRALPLTTYVVLLPVVQGVKKADGSLLLTDPAIHCADMALFGDTNRGLVGFAEFMSTHVCNGNCKKLGLKNLGQG